MLKLSKGDMIDAKALDCLVITKVKESGVNVDRKAFGCSRIPDYFSYKDIDGWSNGELSLHNHGFGIWLVYDVVGDKEWYVEANDVNSAIYHVNCGVW